MVRHGRLRIDRPRQVGCAQPTRRHARCSLVPWPSTRCAIACRPATLSTIFFPTGLSARHRRAWHSQGPSQTGVHILKAVQTIRLSDVHAAIHGLPFKDGRIPSRAFSMRYLAAADAALAAQTGDTNPFGMAPRPEALPCLSVFFQDADDLVFSEAAAMRPLAFGGIAPVSRTAMRGRRWHRLCEWVSPSDSEGSRTARGPVPLHSPWSLRPMCHRQSAAPPQLEARPQYS